MPIHFIVRLQPKPGNEQAVLEELRKVMGPTRAEPGCVAMRAFTSVREPREFGIHSEWADIAAFKTHGALPHTKQFVETVEPLLTHPLRGLLSAELA
jgi:quinol monooxygenase YgiN